MSKKTIVKGTLILTIAGILTKLLGFYNRIFLARLIGVKELGIYQLIFPLYMLAFSFCCQGIATTLTKQVSFYVGQKKHTAAKQVFIYSMLLSVCLSTILAAGMWFLSEPLALRLLKNSDCAPMVKIISVALPFVSVKACINSFFMGNEKPAYHGFSHLIEQIIRIGSAYVLSLLWAAERINANLAVTAVVIGEVCATLVAVLCLSIDKRISEKKGKSEPDTKIKKSVIVSHMLKDAVPITMNNLMFTLFSSLEAIIMPAMLYYYYLDRDMALEMFGVVTGIVIPFLLFPSTITNSLSTMLLPAVSYANATRNQKAIRKALVNSISFCSLLGMCAWAGYLVLGKWACQFAFQNEYAGILLKRMSFLCPLIYLSGSLSAIMNGLDMAFRNLIFNIIGISVRILCSVTLVPAYGLSAYIFGMTASYVLTDTTMLLTLAMKNRKPTASHTVCSDIHNNLTN